MQADEIERARQFFPQGNMLYHPLNTNGAFYSRLMKPSSEQFRKFLGEFTFASLATPAIANVTARPHKNQDAADTLGAQLAGSVFWCDSIQYLIECTDADEPMTFEEVGHGEVLTKMFRHIPKDTSLVANHRQKCEEGPVFYRRCLERHISRRNKGPVHAS